VASQDAPYPDLFRQRGILALITRRDEAAEDGRADGGDAFSLDMRGPRNSRKNMKTSQVAIGQLPVMAVQIDRRHNLLPSCLDRSSFSAP
jgi:hypothetical protein